KAAAAVRAPAPGPRAVRPQPPDGGDLMRGRRMGGQDPSHSLTAVLYRLGREEARAARWRAGRTLRAVAGWFAGRTDYRRLLREGLYEAVPVRGAWWYSLGSATLVLILLQLVTGIFLLFQYVPSTTEALASLRWVREHDPFGAEIRAL